MLRPMADDVHHGISTQDSLSKLDLRGTLAALEVFSLQPTFHKCIVVYLESYIVADVNWKERHPDWY